MLVESGFRLKMVGFLHGRFLIHLGFRRMASSDSFVFFKQHVGILKEKLYLASSVLNRKRLGLVVIILTGFSSNLRKDIKVSMS